MIDNQTLNAIEVAKQNRARPSVLEEFRRIYESAEKLYESKTTQSLQGYYRQQLEMANKACQTSGITAYDGLIQNMQRVSGEEAFRYDNSFTPVFHESEVYGNLETSRTVPVGETEISISKSEEVLFSELGQRDSGLFENIFHGRTTNAEKEAFINKLKEAVGSGCPLDEAGEIRDAFLDTENIVDSKAAKDARSRMISLLDSSNGAEKTLKSHGWKNVAKESENILANGFQNASQTMGVLKKMYKGIDGFEDDPGKMLGKDAAGLAGGAKSIASKIINNRKKILKRQIDVLSLGKIPSLDMAKLHSEKEQLIDRLNELGREVLKSQKPAVIDYNGHSVSVSPKASPSGIKTVDFAYNGKSMGSAVKLSNELFENTKKDYIQKALKFSKDKMKSLNLVSGFLPESGKVLSAARGEMDRMHETQKDAAL